MELNLFDPKDVPQPRHLIKIERLDISPYPDGWRVKVNIDVTPFQERPNLEIRLLRAADSRLVAELSVIETMHRAMEFTIHVRGLPSPFGDFVAEADLYYDEREKPQDKRAVSFTIREGTPPAEPEITDEAPEGGE